MQFKIKSKYGIHVPHNIYVNDKGEPESVHIQITDNPQPRETNKYWKVLHRGQFELIIEQ